MTTELELLHLLCTPGREFNLQTIPCPPVPTQNEISESLIRAPRGSGRTFGLTQHLLKHQVQQKQQQQPLRLNTKANVGFEGVWRALPAVCKDSKRQKTPKTEQLSPAPACVQQGRESKHRMTPTKVCPAPLFCLLPNSLYPCADIPRPADEPGSLSFACSVSKDHQQKCERLQGGQAA